MKSPIFKIIDNSLVSLPTPRNIRTIWNFGSILGLCLGTQVLTGLFLRIHYFSSSDIAFFSVNHIIRDVSLGWLMRITHANGARIFFISLYLHIARGIYYSRYKLSHVWIAGVSISLILIATAFLGYVLPWGQMSFWGATVITNLFSAIPIFGEDIVYWLWGGFAVGQPTLSRFFALHFILPLAIIILVIIHLIFLHQTGSNNPLGINRNPDKIKFHSYFTKKDILGFFITLFRLFIIVLLLPWLLGDTENFIPANPLVTPLHIQPEWYFLFAYAILRSIPNKLGGVIALLAAMLILYFLPLSSTLKLSSSNSPIIKIIWWWFVSILILLTWVGARPVEAPFLILGQRFTVLYFLFYFIVII